MQVEEKCMQICLIVQDALCLSKWIVGVNQFVTTLRSILTHSHILDTTGF